MGFDNPLHIAFLLIVLLLVFGAKRLPEMGRSLGDGLRGFRDTMSGEVTHHMAAAARPGTTRPAPAAVAQAPVNADRQVLAAARMFGAQRGVVEESAERAIEREPELPSS